VLYHLIAGRASFEAAHQAALMHQICNAEPAPFPKGWAPDPDAFKAGLDFSSRGLTEPDRQAITTWYERTIGYVPDSVTFAMRTGVTRMKAAVTRGVASTTTRRWFQPSTPSPEMA